MRLARMSAAVDLAQVTAVLPMWVTPLPVAMPMQQPAAGGAASDTEEETEEEIETEIPAAPTVRKGPELLSFERFALELQAQATDDGGWQLSMSNIDISKRDAPWRAGAIELQWRRQQDGLKLSGKADRLVLQNVWPFLAYAPESEWLARLRALAATGAVVNASVDLDLPSSGPVRYSLQAQLDDVGFAPVGKAPGLSGISGALEARESQGRAQFESSNLQFDLPRYFRAPIEVRTFSGALAWERENDAWKIHTEELSFDSVDGRGQAQLALSVPRDGSSPFMELRAQAQDLDARSTYKYLPAGRLSPRTLAWLDRAFVGGRVESAELVYRGRTREFPFRNGDGEFVVRGLVKGMTFDYQTGWAPATDLEGEVEFRNQGMSVRGVEARVGGLRVAEATASIGDFKVGDLRVRAVATGDLQDGLRFVSESPIGPNLGERFTSLQGHGAATSTVTLELSLKRPERREVDVDTRLANASVSAPDIDAPVTRLNGRLRVRHDGLYSADLQGQWLGGPVHMLAQPGSQQGAARSTEIVASGHASATSLMAALGLPPAVKLSGGTQWRANALIVADTSRSNDRSSMRNLQIDADLEDMEIALPEPLGKPMHERLPLRVEVSFEGKQSMLARASLGDVRGLFRFTPGADAGWTFDRGTLRADAMTPSLPDHGGLRIEGDMRRFVLDDWLALKGVRQDGKKLSEVLRAASVRVGEFEAFGYRWNDLRGILQASEAGWRIDVESPTAAGQLVVPEDFTGPRRLTAQLERLTLTKVPNRPASTSRFEPTRLPNAHVRIGALQTETQALGAVDLQVSRIPQGVQMDALTITNDSMQASLRGRWLESPSGQRSSLTAQVTSTNVGATLRSLGYTPFMEAKRGEVHAELTWPGGPDGRLLERSSGTVTMSVESGQLVSLEPGAGRVLGLFSLAALPRRLALDFSDLTEKGLSFDSVHGDFELRDGNAYTSNLLLRGPAAEIGLAGRTGLAARDYDQTAVVTGNLGVSLPVAGALAGGPAIGAALLLFSQVFKEPLKGIARGYYRITGPWEEPTVERVDAAQVKEAASAAPASRERG